MNIKNDCVHTAISAQKMLFISYCYNKMSFDNKLLFRFIYVCLSTRKSFPKGVQQANKTSLYAFKNKHRLLLKKSKIKIEINSGK